MKLEGLKVIDLSQFLPGPYLTLALADHGAEVIKIEPPGEGDPGRNIGLSDGGATVFFRNLNRGKKSVVLDLKDPEGLQALLRLCEDADVFVESFRPGVVDRLGVGYEALRARNPRIVYCSISAFGQDGPYRDRPAHDLAVEAMGGLLGMTLGRDGYPAMPGVPVADLLAGLQGLSGVLMALLRREATGLGDHIDIGMHDVTVAALPNVLGPTFAEDRHPSVKDERTTGGAAFYQIYDTRDGRELVLGGQEPKFVRALLEALGRPDLIDLCLRGPGPHQAPVKAFLAETFASRTLAQCMEALSGLDLCYSPVKTLPEAIADPNAQARGMVVTSEDGRQWLGPPIRFAHEPAQPHLREPSLGEHTDEVLAGVSAGEAGG
jgi:crotonobetainyl-CoA:carnitine CoA-transferase CaiB-like acyl-CoA transferase